MQDNHVGSALFACAIAAGHLIAGILLAGLMVRTWPTTWRTLAGVLLWRQGLKWLLWLSRPAADIQSELWESIACGNRTPGTSDAHHAIADACSCGGWLCLQCFCCSTASFALPLSLAAA